MWIIRLTNTAEKQLKKYRKSPDFTSFKKAIEELKSSRDPIRLGELKDISGIRYLCYDVTRSLRLLYDVDRQNNLIIIYGLGDHKEVYGKD
jgi:mRNA-degrading endonuclease RelE of RelBE toxin-antitoxin system